MNLYQVYTLIRLVIYQRKDGDYICIIQKMIFLQVFLQSFFQ